MARSLDEIFGTQNKPRTLDQIFAPPAPVAQPIQQTTTFSPLSLQMRSAHNPRPLPQQPSTWDMVKVGDIKGISKEVGLGALHTLSKMGSSQQDGMAANVLSNSNLPFMSKIGQEQQTKIKQGDDFLKANPVNSVPAMIGQEIPNLPLWMAGEGVANLAGKGISKLAPSFAQKASKLPGFIKGGIKDAAAYGTTVAPTESIRDGDSFSQFLDKEKDIPAVLLGGAALRGVGAGAKLGKDVIGEGGSLKQALALRKLGSPEMGTSLVDDVSNAFKSPSLRDAKTKQYEELFSGDLKPTPSQQRTIIREPLPRQGMTSKELFSQRKSDLESVFKPREIKKYNFTTGEQRALQELQDGITEAQNYVRHTDVLAPYPPGTTIEAAYADIKANTGVDLPKLMGNWERAQAAKTKLNPGELDLGRKSGVIPSLKPREGLPQPSLEQSLPRLLPEKPQPLQWTNKDGIQSELLPKQMLPKKQPTLLTDNPITDPSIPAEVKAHPVAEKIVSKLDDIEASARARIQANKGRLNAGLPVDTLVDYGIIGAVKIAKGTVKYTTWAADMISDLGEEVKPHLKDIWKESRKQHALMVDGTFSPEKSIDPTKIKDIGNFKAYTSDVYRIMRDALGKEAGNDFTKPLDMAKSAYTDMQLQLTSKLKKDIVDGLGIKKGSKESALVQRYGEGNITLDELKQAAPNKWQAIVEADKWFRREYDQLIDQVNASKRQIYPNAEENVARVESEIVKVKADKKLSGTERMEQLKELDDRLETAMRGKIVPKRADYYRHFQEMAEGVKGLKNIFDSPANIKTQLIGRSEFTTPRSKWASFAQKRIGNKTEEDAVGGFLNYIPSASYATHIDPQTARLREFTQALRDTTADTHNADTFIGFLDKYANDLAGKTNPADRLAQDIIPGGRKTFAALTWMNNRVKANVVLGKAGSMLAQLANIPNGVAFGKQYALRGLYNSVASIGNKNAISRTSPFLKERFLDSSYRVFDEKLLQQPKKLAVYMMETADKIGTTFIWNTAYAKGLAQKVANPIRYADMATRDLVAGRGIGEVPLLQKSKLFQLIAPFQLEVANLWHVQKDFLRAKDFGALISLYLLNYGFNEIMENTRGSKVTFDPIRATKDALTEKNISPLQRGGRIAGEFISNVPLGQTIASMYPEYGTDNLPSRKALFGSNDPTRFGSSILLAKAAEDPLAKLALPFGGEQVKKTLQGINDLSKGGHFASSGKLSYPVKSNLSNAIKGALFGPSAFNEAKPYYDKNLRPLTKEQTKQVQKSPGQYNAIQDQRRVDSLESKITSTQKDGDLTKAEKANKIKLLQAQIREIERGR